MREFAARKWEEGLLAVVEAGGEFPKD